MKTYLVKKKQTKDKTIFLRIMIYAPYCLNLKQLQNKFKSNSNMFFYLFSKYNSKINQLHLLKESSKKKYQEITNNYLNIGIRVSPAVHQMLKDFSDVTGYSISAIVRFLIEWEYFEYITNRDQQNAFRHLELDSSFEIIITEIEIYHKYFIHEEKVVENFNMIFT